MGDTPRDTTFITTVASSPSRSDDDAISEIMGSPFNGASDNPPEAPQASFPPITTAMLGPTPVPPSKRVKQDSAPASNPLFHPPRSHLPPGVSSTSTTSIPSYPVLQTAPVNRAELTPDRWREFFDYWMGANESTHPGVWVNLVPMQTRVILMAAIQRNPGALPDDLRALIGNRNTTI
jgi:hypothetical protein